jgi:hypothetical protein
MLLFSYCYISLLTLRVGWNAGYHVRIVIPGTDISSEWCSPVQRIGAHPLHTLSFGLARVSYAAGCFKSLYFYCKWVYSVGLTPVTVAHFSPQSYNPSVSIFPASPLSGLPSTPPHKIAILLTDTRRISTQWQANVFSSRACHIHCS